MQGHPVQCILLVKVRMGMMLLSSFWEAAVCSPSYLCKLSDSNTGRSPVRYNLAAGNYHFQVVPQGCGRDRRKLSVKFDIEE